MTDADEPTNPALGEATPTRPILVGGTPLRGLKGIAGESKMRPRLVPGDTTTRYFQRLKNDDFISEFVVLNPVDWQQVFTLGPNGKKHAWGCRHTAPDEITFHPHPAYRGGPICYAHGPACKAEPMYAQPTTLYSFGDSHGSGTGPRPGEEGGGDQGPGEDPAGRAG